MNVLVVISPAVWLIFPWDAFKVIRSSSAVTSALILRSPSWASRIMSPSFGVLTAPVTTGLLMLCVPPLIIEMEPFVLVIPSTSRLSVSVYSIENPSLF